MAGLLRLGFLASFISEPVMKGFVIGLALTIIVGQLPKIFGFEKGEGDFFEQGWHFLTHLDDTQWRTLVVGVLSFAIVMVLRRFAPAVPASLVAVVFGIGVVHLFDLGQHGVAIVGHIESGLPSIGLPHELSLSDYFAASASAVGIMLVALRGGSGRGQDLCGPEPLRDRSQPRARRHRCGQHRIGVVPGHGRVGRPLQDRGQRVQRAPARSCRGSLPPQRRW